MAINQTGQDSTNNDSVKEEPRRDEREREESPEPQFVKRGMGIEDLARGNFRPRMTENSDESIRLLTEVFDNSKGDSPTTRLEFTRDKFKLIAVDSTVMSQPAIILYCKPITLMGTTVSLAHITLIEKSADSQEYRPMPIGSSRYGRDRETFDKLVLADDYMTKDYIEMVKSYVGNAVGSNVQVLVVGNQLALADAFLIKEEKYRDQVMADTISAAMVSIAGYYETLEVRNDLDVPMFTANSISGSTRIELTFDNSNRLVADAAYMPQRTDIVATSTAVTKSENRDERYDAQSDSRVEIIRTYAALDLYVEYQDSMNGRGRRSTRKDDVPFWRPVINILGFNARSEGATVPFTLETALYGIANVSIQSNDGMWEEALRPRNTLADGRRPMLDLGKLNLMNPDPELAGDCADLTANSNDDDISDYIARTVMDNPTIAICIPSTSLNNWVTSLFERAVSSDKSIQRLAIQRIEEAADRLTEGEFREAYDDVCRELNLRDIQPLRSTGIRQLFGTWIDTDTGARRPAIEWNVPAVLAAITSKKRDVDLRLVEEFQRTFETGNKSMEVALTNRLEILRKICPSIHVTTTGEQLEWDPDWLRALNKAIETSGLAPEVSFDGHSHQRRTFGTGIFTSGRSDIGAVRRGKPQSRNSSRTLGSDLF